MVVDYATTRDHSYQLTGLGRRVTEYLAWKETEDGARPRTLDQYERDLARLCLEHPDVALHDDEEDELESKELTIQDYRDTISGFPAGSRRRVTAVFKDFALWMHVEGVAPTNEMARVRYPKRREQKVVEIFTDAEELALASGGDVRDRALRLLLLDAALRRGELINLRRSHVDLETGRIAVIDGKGGKDRVVPIQGRLLSALAELDLVEALEPTDYLMYGRRGNQHTPSRVDRSRPVGQARFYRWWDEQTAQAGIPHKHPHTCRHTFATKWLRAGGSMVTLSKFLGHSSIRTTVDLYGHLVVDDVAAELARVLGEAVVS